MTLEEQNAINWWQSLDKFGKANVVKKFSTTDHDIKMLTTLQIITIYQRCQKSKL